jgi:transcription antitermination factor NusG
MVNIFSLPSRQEIALQARPIRRRWGGTELSRGWAVVMTQSNMERKVLLSAELMRLPAYLPRYADQRGRERLLFNGYVFIDCCEDEEPKLWRLKGGMAPVTFGSVVARCPSGAIEQFRARESKDGYIRFDERFKKNQALIVVDGPYKDKVVFYRDMDRNGRERALFSLLGREVEMPFDRHQLEPLVSN